MAFKGFKLVSILKNWEVSGSFTLQSNVVQNNGKEKCAIKKCAARAKSLVWKWALLLFFHRSRSLRHLALYDFKFCLSKWKLSRASLLALAKSIYYLMNVRSLYEYMLSSYNILFTAFTTFRSTRKGSFTSYMHYLPAFEA